MNLRDFSDEELLSMSDEDFARIKAETAASPEKPDRILGLFGDLNAPLRALAPEEVPPDPYSSTPYAGGGVEVWDPRQDPGPAMGDGPADPDQNPALRQSLDRMAALDRNAYRNIASVPFEAAKVVNSPYDALEHLGTAFMGLIKKATGPAISRAAGITPDDPDIQAAETMGRGLAHQFTKEGREQRPLDPLLTVGGLAVPALRARGALPAASAGGRTAQLARILEDPGMEALVGLFRGSKTAAGKVREALPDMPTPIRNWIDRIPEGTAQRGAQAASDQFLGFSTSTGPRVQRIIREAPEKGTSRIVKEFAGESDDPAFMALPVEERRLIVNERLLVNMAEAVDRIKESVDAFQSEAKSAMAPQMRTGVEVDALEDLKVRALRNLRTEYNTKVANEWQVDVQQRGQVGPGTVTVKERTGDVQISHKKFPSTQATQISSEGRGMQMVEDFHKRLVDADFTTVGALQRFMWEIDAAIKISDTEVGKHAHRALSHLRSEIRKTISDQFGGDDNKLNIYNAATQEYERDIRALHNIQIELGLEPGMLNSAGELGVVDRKGTLNQLFTSMDAADEFAYDTLKMLEERGGVRHAQEMLSGAASQKFLGIGLVQKSEIAQAARGAARAVAAIPKNMLGAGSLVGATALVFGPTTAAIGILGSSVFSPSLMRRFMLDVAPNVRPAFKAAFEKARLAMEKGSRAGIPVSSWIQEGLTIEQILQRLEAADERSDTPRNPRPNATLQALGGITPPF